MITSLNLKNFTVFQESQFHFGDFNVIHGINGAGKTHLLKLLYTSSFVVSKPTASDAQPVRSRMNRTLAEKLLGVFRPDQLGNLARHGAKAPAEVQLRWESPSAEFHFSIGPKASVEAEVQQVPPEWRAMPPVYLPPRELLSLQPEFVGLATERHLPFDDTWLDASQLLNRPLSKGQKGKEMAAMLASLEGAMGGSLVTDSAGRFKLRVGKTEVEAPLLAEGLRKLATLARLLDNKALRGQGSLFWDEPEANLNPRLIKALVPLLLDVAASGVQVFLATHSLFLLREIEVVQAQTPRKLRCRYFGLNPSGPEMVLEQGDTIEASGDIAALDENLLQSKRYMELDL